MERTDEIRLYLKNKHQGGGNNQKGGLFEDFYALYQIVACIAKYKHSFDGVEFQTQLEDTFVDDLLIAHPEQKVYHQLKNTQALHWGNIDHQGDIAFDFVHQIDDCKDSDEEFALKLVYSLKDSKIGEQMPNEIKEHTAVEYFDYQDDLNSLVLISASMKEALKAIAPEGATMDELVNVAQVFLGVWRGCDSRNRISLNEIVRGAERFKHVNLKIYPDVVISDACKCLLDAIDGLEYHIEGRMFYWSIGCMNVNCLWPDKVEDEIIVQHLTDKWKLIEMLS